MKLFKDTDVALVTGAGSGIGRATCQLLAEQGATVVAADINKISADETILSLAGKNHLSVHLDVTKKEQIERVIDHIISQYSSPPTIAVNCAGIAFYQSLLEATEDTYNKSFDINFKGTMWVTQAVCKQLVACNKRGSIVNLASTATGGIPFLTIYCATKGAVESFTWSAAKEFGPHGIRVNAISPGCIDTAMTASYSEIKKIYADICPLKRIGRAEEVAEVAVFLASDRSSYVNGTSMVVHGGSV